MLMLMLLCDFGCNLGRMPTLNTPTWLTSMTGMSLPLLITLSWPDARLSRSSASCSAPADSSGCSSAAVMSLMVGPALAASTTCSSSRLFSCVECDVFFCGQADTVAGGSCCLGLPLSCLCCTSSNATQAGGQQRMRSCARPRPTYLSATCQSKEHHFQPYSCFSIAMFHQLPCPHYPQQLDGVHTHTLVPSSSSSRVCLIAHKGVI